MIFSRSIPKKYVLLDIEALQPIPAMSIPENASGMAVLVRLKSRPVDFWMEPLPKDKPFTSRELIGWINRKSSISLLKARIRDELTPPVKCTRLPSLTVAICTRDRPRQLARCLKSLLRIERAAFGVPVSSSILVVDNAPSTKVTQALVESVPGVDYTMEPRPGLDFSRNRALKEAQGDLLAFIDDDVVVDGGWLEGLMAAWIEYPDAAAFTGQVLPYELATAAQVLFEQRGGFRRGFDTICYGQTLPGHPEYPLNAGVFGTGANMAFQRHILNQLNGFDEALDTGPPLPAGGDHDIFYRLIREGHQIVYKPAFLVFHDHRRERKALIQQYWSWGLGVMALADKWRHKNPTERPRIRYLVRAWFGLRFSELIFAVLRRKPFPFYMILTEMAGGMVGIMGEYRRSIKRIHRVRKQFP
ncbi:MAG: glycosyltransferase [Deltaproteobacteria bacterium]|nr:glycosyltransferase [Deltaproteobacteria bacterium]